MRRQQEPNPSVAAFSAREYALKYMRRMNMFVHVKFYERSAGIDAGQPDNTRLTSYMYILMPISNTHTNIFVDNEGVFRAATNYLLMHIVIWCNSYAYTVFQGK